MKDDLLRKLLFGKDSDEFTDDVLNSPGFTLVDGNKDQTRASLDVPIKTGIIHVLSGKLLNLKEILISIKDILDVNQKISTNVIDVVESLEKRIKNLESQKQETTPVVKTFRKKTIKTKSSKIKKTCLN